VLRRVAALSIVGAFLLGLGVFFPWDHHDGGRSWLDLKFGATGIKHAGLFTAFSPLTLVLGAFAALALAFRPRTRELGAGLLIGFGVAGAVKYVGLLGRVVSEKGEESRSLSPVVFAGVVAGAVLLVMAGVWLARLNAPSADTVVPLGILVPMLLFVAALLIVIGSVMAFNGGIAGGRFVRSVVPDEGWLAIDPLVVPAAALAGIILLASGRRLLAAGLLIALGIESSTLWLRYLGVSAIAPDSNGSLGAGGAVGLLGGVLILVAGLLVWRREESVRRAVPG
jgi:hypothetical protein